MMNETITAGMLRELIAGKDIPALAKIIEGKPDEAVLDLIDRNSFVATKLWSREDIAQILEDNGYPAFDSFINEVINHGVGKSLGDCSDQDWQLIDNAIYNCIEDAAFPKGILVTGPVKPLEVLASTPTEFFEDNLPETVSECLANYTDITFMEGESYIVTATYGRPNSTRFEIKVFLLTYLGDSIFECYAPDILLNN